MAELRRRLGSLDLALIVMACVIGTGIFLTPSQVASNVASPWTAIALWAIGGLLTTCAALAVAELATSMPQAGGPYVFLKATFGDFVGFQYGWTQFIVVGPAIAAALALGAAMHAASFCSLSGGEQQLVAAACIVVFASLNALSFAGARWVQNVATIAKVGVLVAVAGLVLAGDATRAFVPAADLDRGSVPQLGAALLAILWTFEGWSYATFVAGEARRPEQSLPLGLSLGMLAVSLTYCAINVAYHVALPVDQIAASPRVPEAALEASGYEAAHWISVVVIVGIAGALSALFMTSSRGAFAMAVDRFLPARFVRLGPGATPRAAIALQAIIALGFLASESFYTLLAATVAVNWLFHAASGLSVLVLRRTRPQLDRPFRSPFYPLCPLITIATAGAVLVVAVTSAPRDSALALALVAAGTPFYLRRRRVRDDAA